MRVRGGRKASRALWGTDLVVGQPVFNALDLLMQCRYPLGPWSLKWADEINWFFIYLLPSLSFMSLVVINIHIFLLSKAHQPDKPANITLHALGHRFQLLTTTYCFFSIQATMKISVHRQSMTNRMRDWPTSLLPICSDRACAEFSAQTVGRVCLAKMKPLGGERRDIACEGGGSPLTCRSNSWQS